MSPLVVRWLVLALVVVAAAAGGYIHGVRYEEGRQAVEMLEAANAFIREAAVRAERDRKLNTQIARDLDAERDARASDRDEFERRLRNAPRGTLVEVNCRRAVGSNASAEKPAAGSDQPPRADAGDGSARLSAAGVVLWNDAVAGAALSSERAGWLAGANADAAPVEIDDALRHLRVVSELLGKCRAREQETHKWFSAVGLVTE